MEREDGVGRRKEGMERLGKEGKEVEEIGRHD